MDPKLLELIGKRADLSPEELADLDAKLLAYFAEVDEAGPGEDLSPLEHAKLLKTIATHRTEVKAEITARQAAEDEATAEAERILAEARQEMTDEAGDGQAEDGQEDGQEDEGQEQTAEHEQEAIAAAANGGRVVRQAGASLGAMARRTPGTPPPARTEPPAPRAAIAFQAAADVRGFAQGQELTDWSAIGKALANRMSAMTSITGGDGEQVPVVTSVANYPEDRILSLNDPEGNYDKIEAVAGDRAIVAAGGLCLPLPVDYNIPDVGDLGRPFRDSKTRFQAERGGIRTQVPPALNAADAGVGVWTLANDVNPGDVSVPVAERFATKPIVEFNCGTEVSSFVYAMTLRARYNNIRARFNPESVASNARSGLVSHARLSERRLQALQVALSTAITTAPLLGASKDLFAHIDAIAARMRYRQRRSKNTPLQATFPEWVVSMLRADFVRQMPAHAIGDQYRVADALIEDLFRTRNINVSWTLEDMDDAAAGGIGAAQTAGAALDFPDTVRWFLEFPGEVLFLDGGELDLGVVRDSTTNAVNKYETFYETFEGIHFKGAEAPLIVTSTLNPVGSAAALVATATGNATADF